MNTNIKKPTGFNYDGKRIFFVEAKGKDISFERWRADLYYDGCLALTAFFNTADGYDAFIDESKKHTFADYSEARAYFDGLNVETLPEVSIDCTAKHTPGEWMQNADTVWRGKNPIVCHPVNDPRSIADARLIASAPDLLAACESALPWLRLLGNYIGNGVTHDSTNCGVPIGEMGRCEAVGKLIDAIAKATK